MPLITLQLPEYIICCASFVRFVWVIQCAVGLMNSPASGLTALLYTNLLKAFAQFFPSSQMCLARFAAFRTSTKQAISFVAKGKAGRDYVIQEELSENATLKRAFLHISTMQAGILTPPQSLRACFTQQKSTVQPRPLAIWTPERLSIYFYIL